MNVEAAIRNEPDAQAAVYGGYSARDKSRTPRTFLPKPSSEELGEIIISVDAPTPRIVMPSPAAQAPAAAPSFPEVEEFIRNHFLDDKSANILRNQPVDCQAAVIGMGFCEGRNPSAMVMSRIQKWQKG